MATANQTVSDVPSDLTAEELPEIPAAWERRDPEEGVFPGTRAVWRHRETGQLVTVERNRRPTQMHTPETSRDDVGFNARVYREDTTGRSSLSPKLGQRDQAYEEAVRFMAKYPAGEYEIPAKEAWDHAETVEW